MAIYPHRIRWHTTRAALALLAFAWGMPALAAIALTPEWTGPASYTPGSGGSYVLTVTNTGDTDENGPSISTSFPADATVSWACGASSGSNCAGSNTGNGNLSRNSDDIDAGGVLTFTFTVTFASRMTESLLVGASVTDSNSPALTTTDSISSALDLQSDVSVVKTALQSSYTPGTSGTWSIVVSNAGPSDVSGVTVSDSATDMPISSWSCTASGADCTASSGLAGDLVQTVDIPANGSLTYTVTTAHAADATAASIENTATISVPSGTTDPDDDDHSSRASKSRLAKTDFRLAFTPASPSGSVSYTPGTLNNPLVLTVTNDGPSDSAAAPLTLAMPTVLAADGVTYIPLVQDVEWSCAPPPAPAACSTTSGSGNGDIATSITLAAGASVELSLLIDYPSALLDDIAFAASITAATGETDPQTSNNALTQTYAVDRQADITVVKTSSVPDSVNPGTDFSYDIVLTNNGPSDLGHGQGEHGILLTDLLPAELQPDLSECGAQATQPCWEYCAVGNVDPDDCTVEPVRGTGNLVDRPFALAAGATRTVRYYASVGPTADGEIDNVASVRIDPLDTAVTELAPGSGNSSTATITVEVSTDVSVQKTDNATSAVPGDTHSYTVVVRNDGFVAVNDVHLDDAMPLYQAAGDAGFVPGTISWQCRAFDGACCNHNSSNCGAAAATTPIVGDAIVQHGIDLPGQSRVEFTITGAIDPRATGTLSNTAEVTPPAGFADPVSGNNKSTDADTELHPQSSLRLGKTLLNLAPEGSHYALEYQIVVSNDGPSQVQGALITDSLNDPQLAPDSATWQCEASVVVGNTGCNLESGSGPLHVFVDLDVGGELRLLVQVQTKDSATGEVVNTASITSAAGNASDSVRSVLAGVSELSISKSDGLTSAVPGTDIMYTIQVSNAGPDAVFGARVSDVLPPELEDSAWTCRATTPVPGDLEQLGLVGPTPVAGGALVTSVDGRHVYQVAADKATLYVYQREAVPGLGFGDIAVIETEVEGLNDASDAGLPVSGMAFPIDIAISPDGRMLYVLSAPTDDSPPTIAAFARNGIAADPAFGRLAFAGSVTADVPDGAVALVVTAGSLYVGGAEHIGVFRLDPSSLLPVHDDDQLLDEPVSALAVSSADALLFAAASSGNTLRSFSIGSGGGSVPPGRLTPAASLVHASFAAASDLALAAADRQLYLASPATASVSKIDYTETTLAFDTEWTDVVGTDLTVDPLAARTRLALSPDGEHLLVASGGNAAEKAHVVVQMRRDSEGLLSYETYIDRALTGVLGAGNSGDELLVTPDGRHVLLAAGTDAGPPLQVLSRRAPDPLFALIEVDRNGEAANTGLLAPTDVAVSPSGDYVYAVSIAEGALTVFKRNATLGFNDDTAGQHLEFVAAYVEGEDGISGLHKANRVRVSPDGKSVFVSSEVGNTLAVFRRVADGGLQLLQVLRDNQGGVTALSGAQGMAMDSASRTLYVAAGFENAIGVFARDPTSLELEFIGEARGGVAGAAGLGGIRDLAISRDDAQLLGVSAIDNTVVVFNRDQGPGASHGQLTFVQSRLAGAQRPVAIALTGALDPDDDQHVYIAAENTDELVVMRRVTDPANPAFGRVLPLFEYHNLAGGISHMDGPRDLQVGADGKRVYVAAGNSGAVLIFDRDLNAGSANFGGLALVEVRRDEVDGVDGLETVYALAISPDSSSVYAAGFGDSALASFAVGSGSSCSAGGSGSVDDSVDIGVGGTVEYRIGVHIRADATGWLENTATVTQPIRIPGDEPIVDSATDTTELKPEADLSVSKTNDQVSVIAGQPARYEVTVRNPGPSNLVHSPGMPVTISDLLDSNPGFVLGSATWTCVASGSGALDFVAATHAAANGLPALAGVTGLSLVAPIVDGATEYPGYLAAASVLDDALTLFARDPLTGSLSVAANVPQDTAPGSESAFGLAGARAVVASADGRFLYVASRVSDAVSVFAIAHDAGTGQPTVTLVETIDRMVIFPNPGLDQAVHLALSPDDGFLYVAGANDSAIAVFARNATSGRLVLVESERDGVNDPDDTGGTVAGLANVQFLVVSPDGGQLYALSGSGGSIARFDRDAASGRLAWRSVRNGNDLGAPLAGASSAVFDTVGDYLYVTATDANSVVVLERGADGNLAFASAVTQGSNGTQGLLGPARALLSADGAHLYVSSQSGSAVAWFGRDPLDGTLRYLGQRSNESTGVSGLGGATGLAFDPLLGQLYVAGTLDGALVQLQRHNDSSCPPSGSGELDAVPFNIAAGGNVVFTIDVDVSSTLTGPLHNEVTLDVASDTNSDNDTATDTDAQSLVADLTISKDDELAEYDGLAGASAIAGDAEHLYVAGSADNAIGVFSRNDDPGQSGHGDVAFSTAVNGGEDGALGLAAVADLLLSVDGEHVYAVSPVDNSIAAYRRDRSDGRLEFLGIAQNGVLGVTGLSGARALAQSADGAHVYVAGNFSNAVAVFARNTDPGSPDYGKLSFRTMVQDGVGGVGGIAAPIALALSADGKHLYVLGAAGDTLATFARNANPGSSGFGDLVFAGQLANGGAITGMGGVRSLVLGSDGTALYVLGAEDGAIAQFQRDPGTGQLVFDHDLRDGEDGVSGLAGASRLRMAGDGSVLHVASANEAAVLHFAVAPGSGTLAFGGRIANGETAAHTGGQVLGLAGVSDLLPGADGAQLYTVAAGDAALSHFARSPDGMLDYRASLFDGLGGIAPGEAVTYLIRVDNLGPSDVDQANVVDTFPEVFTSVQWTCTSNGGASCPLSGSGNIDTTVRLPVGGRVVFAATGVVGESASGRLSNTATVAARNASDPDESSNSATDDDTVLSPASDLVVTVDNGTAVAVPGGDVAYTVSIASLGPSYAAGVRLGDAIPPPLYGVQWSCAATPLAGVLSPSINPVVASLDGYRRMTLSALGRFAYAVGERAGVGALAVYARDPLTGYLTPHASYENGVDGVLGIAGASDVELTSDERFVFVAGSGADAIAVFARDAGTGLLEFVAHYQDGEFGIDGLGGVRDLVLSADGRHLYAAGTLDDAIAVFAVDADSGALAQLGSIGQAQPGIDGLNGVLALAFSTDGGHLFAIAGDNQSLAAFARDGGSGLLTPAALVQDFELGEPALLGATALRVHGDQIFVAATSGNRVARFAFDAAAGFALDWTIADGSNGVDGLAGPRDMLFDADEARLYVASTDNLHLFSLLGEAPEQLAQYPATTHPQVAGIAGLAMAPNGKQLYTHAADAAGATIGVWTRERGSRCPLAGERQLEGAVVDIAPYGAVVFQVGGHVFPNASGQLRYEVRAEPRTAGEEINPADNVGTDTDLLTPSPDLAASKSDGRTEVVAGTALSWRIDLANAGVSDALLARFSDALPVYPAATAGITAGSASWTCAANAPLAGGVRTGAAAVPLLDGVTAMAIAPGGGRLFAANPAADALLVFPRAANGTLGTPQVIRDGEALGAHTVHGLAGASSVTVTADGAHLLVTGADADSLVVFALGAGGPGLLQTLTSGSDGIVGLRGAADVVASADGTRVFVAGAASNAIAAFARDPDTGVLTFIERVADGLGTILPDSNVIKGVHRLHLSHDGARLYALAATSRAVSSFAVHPGTGKLTYLGALRQGEDIDGLGGARDLVAAPGDDSFYVLGDAAINLLQPQADGALVPVQRYDAIPGLSQGRALAMDAPGSRLYVADADGAVHVFARDWSNGALDLRQRFVGAEPLLPATAMVNAPGADLYVAAATPGRLERLAEQALSRCATAAGSADLVDAPLDLGVGGWGLVNVAATVDPSARGMLSNSAVLLPVDGADPAPADNTGIDTTQITAVADLSLSKQAPATAIAGEEIAFDLVVGNAGPSSALGFRVFDDLVADLQDATWTCSASAGSSCPASGSGDLDVAADLLPGGRLEIRVVARIAPGFLGTLGNHASLLPESGATDPVSGNDSASTSTEVTARVDLSVSKTSDSNGVVAGAPVRYRIGIANAGPSDAPAVRLLDLLPPLLSDAQWTCSGSAGSTCPASGSGDVDAEVAVTAGGSIELVLTATLDAAAEGSLVNSASASVLDAAVETAPGDESATDTDAIVQRTDLSVQVLAPIDPADPAGPFALPIDVLVHNHGPSLARGATLQIGFSAPVSVGVPPGCSIDAVPVLRCALADLDAADGTTLALALRGLPAAPGSLTVTATVAAAATDPQPANDVAVRSVQLRSGGDIQVSIDNDADKLAPGHETTYVIDVVNLGSLAVADIDLQSPIAAELFGATWTCSSSSGVACTASGSGAVVDQLTLQPGQRVRYLLHGTVDPALDPAIPRLLAQTVSATVAAASDYNLLNNNAVDEDVVHHVLFADGFEDAAATAKTTAAGGDRLQAGECALLGIAPADCNPAAATAHGGH